MRPAAEAPELGRDTLDPVAAPSVWGRIFPARGSAFGLGAASTPAVAVIALGVLLGPAALDILTPTVLARLDPVVSIALAALGVFVGLGIGASGLSDPPRVLAAALSEVAITTLVVGGGLFLLLAYWSVPLPYPMLLFAAVAGICASASAATRITGNGQAARASRIVDLDDVPLVALGAVAVAVAGARPVLSGVVLVAAAAALAGWAGWMLFERARGEAERGAFVAGTLALVGGVGAYSGTSPLLGGAIAALVWTWSPGRADRIIAADLRRLQHPLVALLLIVAGASIEWQYAVLWVAAPLVLLRLIGKLAASLAVAGLVDVQAGLLAAVLLPPGVLGVAVALNVQQVLGFDDMLLVSSVTVAAAVSELISVLPLAGADEASS